MDFFVTSRSIRDWADTMSARAVLPHVIRRLVRATATGINQIDFPAYESVQRPGFDGIVECSGGNAWVPTGRSVWELSTDKGVKGKADVDFEKRTNETPRLEQEQSVYVCLTPRQFKNKRDWIQQRETDGFWRGVRAYDSDDLEQWAEAAPAGITAWFGDQIGSRPPGVDDVAQRWNAISKGAAPALLPSVFLAGRDQSSERVKEWLSAEPCQLAIDCRSTMEVIDFFCAFVAAMPEEDRVAVESRAVIIFDTAAWPVLRDATVRAVLIIDPSLPLTNEEIQRAVANGHHVLVATEPTFLAGERGPELERASEFELTKALEESGYPPVKAEQTARASGGSLSILKHRLAPSGSITAPQWASDVSAEVVTACLLLGGWSSNEADQLAFSAIAGRGYSQCESELQRMANSRDPLLLHAAGNWRLISKDHAWSLFQDRVVPSALNSFESLAVEILADDDPRYLLPEGERLFAGIRGHIPKYSETVKKHVAETLAFLGAFGTKLEAASSISIEAAIDRIVALVLSPTCTWHRWASLGSRLPLLAEASPVSFLRAARGDLDRTNSELEKLLHEEEEALFGRCNHAGLLWALEGLAWPKEYLGDVVRILLALADRDTGENRWGNRPKNSLIEILSYWMPHTTADVNERIQILDLLMNCNREATWPVLLSLLPEVTGGVSMPTHRPYWRGWADSWVRGATRDESMKFITATAERIIREAGVESKRWSDIFERIGRLPYTVHQQLLVAADFFSNGEIPDIECRSLSEELSQQIHQYRQSSDANWSLPPDLLDGLETILEKLKPQSSVLRSAWLFAQWPDRFFERGTDHAENQAALDQSRRDAVREILDSEGFAGIELLIEQAQSPNDVGRALAMTTGDEYLLNLIPARLEGDQRDLEFVGGFVWSRFWPDDWKWVDHAVSLCKTDTSRANLLMCLRFAPDVWNRAAKLGGTTSNLYWDQCRAFNPDLLSTDVALAVRNLCKHNRPAAAIDLLSMAIHKERDLDSETLLSPLELLLRLPAEESDSKRGKMDGYNIREMIGALQERDDVEQSRLIAIEWHYIRLLDQHSEQKPRTLQAHLSSSPEFFNEVLSFCYRSQTDEDTGEVENPSAHRRYMAEHAFHLLHDWDCVPGAAEGGVDEDMLRKWCIEARHIAERAGRIEVCDSHIGQLFARSKLHDENGSWPCAAIRRIAEEIGTDSLGSGMSCGIRNLRGAGFRASGGDQERALAAQFREKADRIRFDSPFVGRTLDSVVKSYENEAKWWDERDRWEE